MGRSNWRCALATAVLAASLIPAAAMAESAADGSVQPAKEVEPLVPAFGPVLDDQGLEDQRGKQDDAVFNDMRSKASVYQNSTNNVSTGDNSINGTALSNANGMPIVVQNSGNNVVIQNSTILNLQLK
jgi:hypothetical protein